MEYLKDYDCLISYHPGKANVVADALSRRSSEIVASMMIKEWELIEEFSRLTVSVKSIATKGYLANLTIQPDIVNQIRVALQSDARRNQWIDENDQVKAPEFSYQEGILQFQGRTYVPKDQELRQVILREAHRARYTVHPGSTKMYKDLREMYWWPGMKKDVARYVAQCDTCQRIKIEHQRPGGMLQPLEIPEWKWDHVTMDFVTSLPRSPKGNDVIWVIVDRLTKSVHFLSVKIGQPTHALTQLYIEEIV